MTAPDHVFDELPGMLAGELDRFTTGRVAAHLRTCDDCRQELVLVVSAGAALRSAARFAPQAVLEAEEALPDPSLFLAELATERPAPGGQPGRAREPEPAGSGSEARPGAPRERPATRLDQHRPGHHTRPSPRRRWWYAVAAAVLLLAGLGAGVLITRDPTGPQIAMTSDGPWTATATATLQGDRLDIRPRDLPSPKAGHYYEVWLANQTGRTTPKVLSVGVLNPSGASLTVPPSLASAYNTIVVTDEMDNGNPAPSGNSVMSGPVPPPG